MNFSYSFPLLKCDYNSMLKWNELQNRIIRHDTNIGRFYYFINSTGKNLLLNHRYETFKKFISPSVTTLLKWFEHEDMPIDIRTSVSTKIDLEQWKSLVGHEEAERQSFIAKSKGNRFHELMDNYAKTGFIDVSSIMPDTLEMFYNVNNLLIEKTKYFGNLLETEYKFIYNDNKESPISIGGTIDMITINDHIILTDYKTIKSLDKIDLVLPRYKMQLALYALQYNYNVKGCIIFISKEENKVELVDIEINEINALKEMIKFNYEKIDFVIRNNFLTDTILNDKCKEISIEYISKYKSLFE